MTIYSTAAAALSSSLANVTAKITTSAKYIHDVY
jgi:hypothetical protein